MLQPIGHMIITVASTASTNNYASRQIAVNEIQEGTVFLAYEQTAGRGQLTNRWESKPGQNLTFSIFLQPSFLELYRQFMLSKAISLGIVSFLRKYVEGVKIKWPNDIYIEDSKICGILIENSVMKGVINQTIIGIGLNVNQCRFYSDAPNPVSLKMKTGTDYNLDVVLAGLLRETDLFYKKLEGGQYDELDHAFLQSLYRINEWHDYEDMDHRYTGKIIGVNAIGQLQVQEKDGPLHEYHFKEVAYL